ncbi:MAG: hypothetical protein M1308_14305 [Actinobacteria bacterium]|nr:hypothetical protein [Actinomycetota bacterium]MCL5072044.1 hypothetical protein [Actinomycetota bacterium]
MEKLQTPVLAKVNEYTKKFVFLLFDYDNLHCIINTQDKSVYRIITLSI